MAQDTITFSTDSLGVATWHCAADSTCNCSHSKKLTEAVAIQPTYIPIDSWTNGLEPEQIESRPYREGGIILIIALIIILVISNFHSLRDYLTICTENLITIRKGRDNVFDERQHITPPVFILIFLLLIFCGGFFLSTTLLSAQYSHTGIIPAKCIYIGIAIVAVYYIIMWMAYKLVAYTFASEEKNREWLRGFTSSTALFSIALAAPALIALFYPESFSIIAVLVTFLFFLSKIVFIFKGFRIFYDNFFSLIYFILYLCTLEIVPIILVYNFSQNYLNLSSYS